MTSRQEQRGLDVNLRSGPQMREYVAIADRIAGDRPASVLDWGCGFGQVSALLNQRGLNVRSLDYRPDEPPGRRPLERFPEILADMTNEPVKLPYADGEFDAALSCGVLEHVADPDGSLDELRRVLRPGGTLYVYKLPNRFSYLERIARMAGLYYHGQLPDDRVYTLRSGREILERHGFRVREARLQNMLPLTIAHPLAMRFGRGIWRLSSLLSRVPGLSFLATNVEYVAER